MTARSWDVARTAGWFVATIAALELVCWIVFTYTPMRSAHLRSYLWYGESYEAKLRALASTPNLSTRSVLYAGWLSEETLHGRPADVDVTVYGSSFAGNLAKAMQELRPGSPIRSIGGPGAPLNHTYAMYELDRPLRKTKVAVIGVVSENVGQVLTMNVGSVYAQLPMPYFFPRYDIVNHQVVRTGESLLNSSTDLKRAFADPALWQGQLDVLARHDEGYRDSLFSADVFDYSLYGRLIRRGLATRHAERYSSATHSRTGYKQNAYSTQVFRALLVRMITDIRNEGVKPVVVLFATRGYDDHLRSLVEDLLTDNRVPFISSFDVCRSTDVSSYLPDGHFKHACDLEMARRTLEIVDSTLSGAGR